MALQKKIMDHTSECASDRVSIREGEKMNLGCVILGKRRKCVLQYWI